MHTDIVALPTAQLEDRECSGRLLLPKKTFVMSRQTQAQFVLPQARAWPQTCLTQLPSPPQGIVKQAVLARLCRRPEVDLKIDILLDAAQEREVDVCLAPNAASFADARPSCV